MDRPGPAEDHEGPAPAGAHVRLRSDGAEDGSAGTARQGAPPASVDTRAAAREAAAAARLLGRQLALIARAAGCHLWRSGRAGAASAMLSIRDRTARPGSGQRQPMLGSSATPGWVKRLLGPLRETPLRASAAFLVGLPIAVAAGLVGEAALTLPPLGGVQPEGGQRALTVEADDGRIFATRGAYRGEPLQAQDMPAHLAKAVIAIEDRRFHSHWGIDPKGLARAAWRNALGGGVREGGSTLTQQYARLISLSQEKTLRRKIQEALLAFRIEWSMSKEEILLGYLNTAYFGAGAYGIDAAARRYFGHGAKNLSLPEAAMLAGLVRAPSALAPTRNFGGAKERADLVLQTMVETEAITGEEADKARREPVTLRTPPETPAGANYFLDQLAADVRRLTDASGDVTVRSTLNLDLQSLAEAVVARRLEAEGARKRVGQAALVAMRKDGAILALVGGRDYEDSQFNRAVQAKRQAGSLFKLFVYLAAYANGFTPESVLVDRPTQIGEWEPQNANNRYRGAQSLRSAFALSTNTIAAQLADEVGIRKVIATARRLGVESELPDVPSLALGSADVSLLEMVRAYGGVLAGATPEPFTVRSIEGLGPSPLYRRDEPGSSAQGKPAPEGKAGGGINGDQRSMMLDCLEAVVQSGTGKAARLSGLPTAGKTGTSQEYRDAWFVGFTPDMVVGIWVGNDDNAPMNRVTGGDIPARIFHDFVERGDKLLKGRTRPAPSAARAERAPPGEIVTAQEPPGATRGVPEVVDTGTLAFRGQVVRLHGVEGEGGRMARQLARYLRRRVVECAPEPGAAGLRCTIDGEDLATVIVAAGGARAGEGAPPELIEAEDHARSERAGLWSRRR